MRIMLYGAWGRFRQVDPVASNKNSSFPATANALTWNFLQSELRFGVHVVDAKRETSLAWRRNIKCFPMVATLLSEGSHTKVRSLFRA